MFFAISISEELLGYWQYFLLIIGVPIALVASSHAIIWKRDSRSALIWASLIWFLPLVGSCLYSIFGINRIKRRASLLRKDHHNIASHPGVLPCPPDEIIHQIDAPSQSTDLGAIATTIGNLSKQALLPGNAIGLLENGDAAFPAMRRAIASAQHSLSLSTYIFDFDPTGKQFAEDLSSAMNRGVAVRVLIDSTGARYSWPPITDLLTKLHIPFARFLPPRKLARPLTLNLHNHRKIMVIDGKLGFTGGMNIRHSNNLILKPKRPVCDLHFQLKGPIVAHLQSAFAEDWAYATSEILRGEDWFPKIQRHGNVLARGITDGPDEDLGKLIWAILAALNAARHSVWILTPYFLPEAQIIAALNAAALRGVDVRVLIPEENNLPFMNWATSAMLWQLIFRGCKFYTTPPPFDHTKLMVVDDCWSMIGSSNWDARSLRLNFEFNVECYSNQLTKALRQHIALKLRNACAITLDQLESRPPIIKLRDGVIRLFSPFL